MFRIHVNRHHYRWSGAAGGVGEAPHLPACRSESAALPSPEDVLAIAIPDMWVTDKTSLANDGSLERERVRPGRRTDKRGVQACIMGDLVSMKLRFASRAPVVRARSRSVTGVTDLPVSREPSGHHSRSSRRTCSGTLSTACAPPSSRQKSVLIRMTGPRPPQRPQGCPAVWSSERPSPWAAAGSPAAVAVCPGPS